MIQFEGFSRSYDIMPMIMFRIAVLLVVYYKLILCPLYLLKVIRWETLIRKLQDSAFDLFLVDNEN